MLTYRVNKSADRIFDNLTQSDLKKLAMDIEEEMYLHTGRDSASPTYRAHIKQLIQCLRDESNQVFYPHSLFSPYALSLDYPDMS